MLKLNSGQVVFMSWEKFVDGLNDVISGRDTREAYIIRNTVVTDSEYCARNLALLRAVMNPIDTGDLEAVRRYQASKTREVMRVTVSERPDGGRLTSRLMTGERKTFSAARG
jgi:hypothetical protein